jgi:hypothetical protein
VSVLYAILQFGITGIVYFNPFIGELAHPVSLSPLQPALLCGGTQVPQDSPYDHMLL